MRKVLPEVVLSEVYNILAAKWRSVVSGLTNCELLEDRMVELSDPKGPVKEGIDNTIFILPGIIIVTLVSKYILFRPSGWVVIRSPIIQIVEMSKSVYIFLSTDT